MRICMDCKHEKGTFCLKSAVREVSPVSGKMETIIEARFCQAERKHGLVRARLYGSCGKEGRFYSARINDKQLGDPKQVDMEKI